VDAADLFEFRTQLGAFRLVEWREELFEIRRWAVAA
jgi:hypothetical protein